MRRGIGSLSRSRQQRTTATQPRLSFRRSFLPLHPDIPPLRQLGNGAVVACPRMRMRGVNPDGIYHEQAYAQSPVVSFTRELLEMSPEAQTKALSKVRRLEQSFLSPLVHLRAPP
jgi:hypothetical protein